jgi:peptidase E
MNDPLTLIIGKYSRNSAPNDLNHRIDNFTKRAKRIRFSPNASVESTWRRNRSANNRITKIADGSKKRPTEELGTSIAE